MAFLKNMFSHSHKDKESDPHTTHLDSHSTPALHSSSSSSTSSTVPAAPVLSPTWHTQSQYNAHMAPRGNLSEADKRLLETRYQHSSNTAGGRGFLPTSGYTGTSGTMSQPSHISADFEKLNLENKNKHLQTGSGHTGSGSSWHHHGDHPIGGDHKPLLGTGMHDTRHLTSSSATSSSSSIPAIRGQERTMLLSEEKLEVEKTLHNAGGLDIDKRIERERASIPVTLEREVVTIERRPVTHGTSLAHTGHTGQDGSAFGTAHAGHGAGMGVSGFGTKQEIRETVSAEQAIAHKQIAPREELVISKERVGQVETVQGAVRSEHVDVKHDVGNVDAVRWDGSATASGASGAVKHGGQREILDSDGKVIAYEERLAIGKDRVPAGEVQVSKRIDTNIASKPVTLMHDELQVTRHAFDGASSSALPTTSIPSSLTEGHAHIGLTRERAHAATVVVPKEEIVVRKDIAHDRQHVTTELLKERIDIQPAQGAYTETASTHLTDKGSHLGGDKFGSSSSSSSSSWSSSSSSGLQPHSSYGSSSTSGDKFASSSSSLAQPHQPIATGGAIGNTGSGTGFSGSSSSRTGY